MPDPTVPVTADNRCKCGFRAPELGPHPACPIHAVTADDLRDRYAEAILKYFGHDRAGRTESSERMARSIARAVLAFRDEELERLRAELASAWQNAQDWHENSELVTQRAEQAEAERDALKAAMDHIIHDLNAGGVRAEYRAALDTPDTAPKTSSR